MFLLLAIPARIQHEYTQTITVTIYGDRNLDRGIEFHKLEFMDFK